MANTDAPALELVESVAQVRRSIATFNSSGGTPELLRSMLRSTSYWVFDPNSHTFGPGKFVRLRNQVALGRRTPVAAVPRR